MVGRKRLKSYENLMKSSWLSLQMDILGAIIYK